MEQKVAPRQIRDEKITESFLEWKWECCCCRAHAGMDITATTHCPSCAHLRCSDCQLESVKRRKKIEAACSPNAPYPASMGPKKAPPGPKSVTPVTPRLSPTESSEAKRPESRSKRTWTEGKHAQARQRYTLHALRDPPLTSIALQMI